MKTIARGLATAFVLVAVTPLLAPTSLIAPAPVMASASLLAQDPSTVPAGTLERIRVHGASLEGNLSGDDPTRDVVVYLPPSYEDEPERHYPVVYFLHGYSVGAEVYVQLLGLPGSVDRAIAAGARETIVVLPDAYTVYSGSMYGSSPTTGDWERFVAHDLVAFIDSHYRTIPQRAGRGLAGHSMGGYGTYRVGMKQPGVFAGLYPMSSCCLMNDPGGASGTTPTPGDEIPAPGSDPPEPVEGGGFANALFAQAASWAPNPENPPYFLDLPFDYEAGEVRPLVAARWVANSPMVMVDQYVPELTEYEAIGLEIGDEDGGLEANRRMADQLERLGIEHTWDVYPGNHTNRLAERMETAVIPFFSEILERP